MRFIHWATLVVAATVGSAAGAQDRFPSRSVQLVIPLTTGNTVDVVGRLVADKMSKAMGQGVVVVNKPGAGGIIGTQFVAGAAPDGYTLLMNNTGHLVMPLINKNVTFDPIKDFKGLALLADAPALVVVPAGLGANTLADFVRMAREKPGSINYASAGIGSATHLAGAYFAKQAGIDIVHVPYKTSADIISDLLANRVQACFAPAAFVLPLLKDGRLKALAIGAPDGIEEPVRVPSARSQGVDYVNSTWYGMVAPANTPPATMRTLADTLKRVSADPEVKDTLVAQGLDPKFVALDAFDDFLKKDAARLAPLLQDKPPAQGAKAP